MAASNGQEAQAQAASESQAAAPATASGFSLTFSKSGRSGVQPRKQASRPEPGPDREPITGFSGGQSEGADPRRQVQKGRLVIAKQENTFQLASRGPRGYNPDRFLPDQDDASRLQGADRFELVAPEAKPTRQYGLQQRTRPSGPAGEPTAASDRPSTHTSTSTTAVGTEGAPAGLRIPTRPGQRPSENGDAHRGPTWMQARRGPGGRPNAQDAEADVLRRALESMPDMATEAEYEAIPVEAFGEAMLRGMGWIEGRALGRRDMEDVTAPEYVRRPEKLGLGAQPAPPPKPASNKRRHPSDAPQGRKDLVYIDPSGVQRNVKPSGAALVERPQPGPRPNKRMRVTGGTHSGLVCTVVRMGEGTDPQVTVRLHPSEEQVAVASRHLGELSDPLAPADPSPAHHRDPSRTPEPVLANGHSKEHKQKKRHRKEAKREKKRRKKEGKRSRSSSEDEESEGALQPSGGEANAEPPWLAPHIIVKFIDKQYKGGRFYLKRAQVLDVRSPTSCDIYLAEARETIAGVHQSQLETVVPRAQMARVLLVRGPLARQQAKLLDRGSEGVATVQLLEDFSVLSVRHDDIAEFVGEPGEDE